MNKFWVFLVSFLIGSSVNAATTKRSKAEAILKAKCMDCHSDKTVYPWYYNMPGAKQLMDADIEKGKAYFHLENELYAIKNEKEIPQHIIKRLIDVVEHDRMPLIQYRLAHWDKVLTNDDKKVLLDWLNSIKTGKSNEEPIQPLPLKSELKLNEEEVSLGKALYHDTRLSGDNTLSCASCHDLNKGGTDQARVSTGIRGQKGGINAPTTFNSSYNILQFWDGRAEDLVAQAAGPVTNPIEMGAKWDDVITKLSRDPALVKRFEVVYGAKQGTKVITKENVTAAIAEFEKSLITSNNRFDKYLRGDKKALTADEVKGYELFKKYNCTSCHNGPAVGGSSFQKMGVTKDYFADRAKGLNGLHKMAETKIDHGRFNFTNKVDDKYKFKVPTLRNIALTYPYMHDGNVDTLEEAVRIMGECQVGTKIPKQDVDLIVKFLKTL